LEDLGQSSLHQPVRDAMKDRLFSWVMNLRTRTTVSDDLIEKLTGSAKAGGYRFGEW
jgi:hypothetical protein